MTDFGRMTREFLIGEWKKPGVQSHLQMVSEILDNITPRSQQDTRRVEMAKSSLREIRKEYRRLDERVGVLEEQLQLLEENKEG